MAEAIERAVRNHQVVVVTAPSGYGKTTAVAGWAAKQSRPVAWLSLASADEDRTVLSRGIVTALRGLPAASAAHRSLLQVDSEVDLKTIYSQLCHAVQLRESSVVLVIDDAHRAGDQLMAGLSGMLLERLPEQLRLVLLGTTRLEAVLAKQILTTPDAHVMGANLAFDLAETAALLKRTGTPLRPREVLDLTHGWPIAVHLTALGGQRPSGEDTGLEELLRGYVQNHVLTDLPERLALFALTTSACTEVTVELATALTGREDAAEMLEELANRGIFVSRYLGADHAAVYRWHPLFARQCTRILAHQDVAALSLIHRRAGEYLLPLDPVAALGHFVAARDYDRAVAGLVSHWVHLILGDHAGEVAAFCAGLPERWSGTAVVQLIWACAEEFLGEHKMARTRFVPVVEALESQDVTGDVRSVLPVAQIVLCDDRQQSLDASHTLRALLISPGVFEGRERAAVLYLLGWTELRWRLRPKDAPEMMSAAARQWAALGDTHLEHQALASLALINLWAGKNDRARQVLLTLTAFAAGAGLPSFSGGGASGTAAGLLAYWAGDCDRASEEFCRVIDTEDIPYPFGGAVRMLLAFSAAGTREAAWCRRAAAELQAIPATDAQGAQWPVFRDAATAVLEEAAGHSARAVALVERHPEVVALPMVAVVLAGVLRRAGDPVAAYRLVSGHDQALGVSYVAVAARMNAALVCRLRGDPEAAHQYCEMALDIAERENIRQPFCDGDLNLRLLLSDHLARRTAHESFITGCLTAVRHGGVLSALSEREADVFRLLQTSKTIREIAEELYVSVNTVKTHQRAIYRKLGVQTRRQAQQVAP